MIRSRVTARPASATSSASSSNSFGRSDSSLLVVATIPAGLLGLAFEHALRSVFASPTAAARSWSATY
jgi:undecaprenyl pyrophosphate phosphatase UppP